MTVTYLSHSGFCIEWEDCVWIFDYDKGTLPEFSGEKPVFFFVSHFHADHFNPEIFLRGETPAEKSGATVRYVLSYDIKLTEKKLLPLCRRHFEGAGRQAAENGADPAQLLAGRILRQLPSVLSVRADSEYGGGDGLSDGAGVPFRLATLKSTDSGVAFLLEYRGITVYHAGDLNWWIREEDTKQEYGNMTAKFMRQMDKLKNRSVDFAFLPLDPGQGAWYWRGFDYFMRNVSASVTFPMHCWEDYGVIRRMKARPESVPYRERIADIKAPGQVFEFPDFAPDMPSNHTFG